MNRVRRSSTGTAVGPSLVKSQTADEGLTLVRRGQIVDAAVKLFAERGFYRTTVQQIARKAGISSGLVYHYARTKEDILLLALMSVLERYKQELPPAIARASDPLGRLHACLRAYCEVVDRSRDATVLAYRSTKTLPRNQRALVMQLEVETNALIERCIQDCIDAGDFRQVDVALTAYHLVGFAHAWALKHWRLASLATQEEYFRQGFEFFVRALATPRGWRRYLRQFSAAAAGAASTST